jgi:2-dehydro-3-deoxygalactonokinase
MTTLDTAATFIAGDWGTSHLRLMLCAADGTPLESCQGPGAAASRGRFAEVFDALTSGWRQHGAIPTLLCGMAGSTFGWQEAAYLRCPQGLAGLADRLLTVRPDVHIVPGLICTNVLGAPDVMRGEETQLLGALALEPALARGRQLLCMPGTHTKWVSLDDGVVQQFLTVPTGELFRMLCDHSVLVRDRDTPVEHHDDDFVRGLEQAVSLAGVPLLHQLFQARSRRLDGELTALGAPAWTSGLLIGADVAGALPLLPDREPVVTLIATGPLTTLYAQALARHGRPSRSIAGEGASLAGLASIQRQRIGGL